MVTKGFKFYLFIYFFYYCFLLNCKHVGSLLNKTDVWSSGLIKKTLKLEFKGEMQKVFCIRLYKN